DSVAFAVLTRKVADHRLTDGQVDRCLDVAHAYQLAMSARYVAASPLSEAYAAAMPMRDEPIQRAIQHPPITLARPLPHHGAIGSVEAGTLRSEIEALYPAFLGTSAALLRRLGTEDILGVLRTAGYVDGERAYLLGALFEAEAELLVAESESTEENHEATSL